MQSQYAQPQNGGYAQNPAGGSNADIRNTGYSPDGARYRGESVYGNEYSRNSFEGDPSANGYGNGADYGQGANYPNYPVNGNDYSDPSAESAYGNSSVGGTYEKYNEYGFPADNVRQRPGVTLSRNPDGYAASGQATRRLLSRRSAHRTVPVMRTRVHREMSGRTPRRAEIMRCMAAIPWKVSETI